MAANEPDLDDSENSGEDIPAFAPSDFSGSDAAFDAIIDRDRPSAEPRSTDNRMIDIARDITDHSTCTGDYKDFETYFQDRYEKLSTILEQRPNISPRSISALEHTRDDAEVTVVGMVMDKWSSRNNHQMLQLDDPTGSIKVIITDEELKETCISLLTDEVIAISGQVTDDKEAIFGNDIYFPDVPASHRPNTARRHVKAALISDIHFGTREFSAKKWNRFVDWIRQTPDIEYLLVAGDLVEGIGVYPGQKEELVVTDIYEQYELCAEAFKELPDDLDIISIVGNHDSVRQAEPQPTLREEFREPFADNVRLVGNPSMVTLEGVKFLLYHGVSLNPIIEMLPGQDIQEPANAMKSLVKKRHLAPMWGSNVRIAPEDEDYLAMDVVPDVFHTGHVHTWGVDNYHGVNLVNTGTWQERTDFQKSMNVHPDVGRAAVVDLKTLDIEEKRF